MPLNKISNVQTAQPKKLNKFLEQQASSALVDTEQKFAPAEQFGNASFDGRKILFSNITKNKNIANQNSLDDLKSNTKNIADIIKQSKNGLKYNDSKQNIIVTDQPNAITKTNEDIVCLASVILRGEDLKDIRELVRIKRIEAMLDDQLLKSMFNVILKNNNSVDSNYRMQVSKFEKQIKESEEIISVLENFLSKQLDLEKSFFVQKFDNIAVANFISILKDNSISNSLVTSGEGHDNSIMSVISNLTSCKINSLKKLDIHHLLWVLLSDIQFSYVWGMSPGYLIPQGNREYDLPQNYVKNSGIESLIDIKQKLQNKRSKKNSPSLLLPLGDDTINLIPKPKMSALEKVAYYSSLITTELRSSVGMNLVQQLDLDFYDPARFIGITNNINQSNNDNSVFSSLFFNDTSISSDKGSSNILYANPNSSLYNSNQKNLNFALKNYVSNFFDSTINSPGNYNFFIEQLQNNNNKLNLLKDYIKIMNLHAKNDVDLLKPSNLFKRIISNFFELVLKAFAEKNKNAVMSLLISRKLHNFSIANVRNDDLNLNLIKKNQQLKTVIYYQDNNFEDSKLTTDLNYGKVTNAFPFIKNNVKILEFMSTISNRNSEVKNIQFTFSYDDVRDAITDYEDPSYLLPDVSASILKDLEKECARIVGKEIQFDDEKIAYSLFTDDEGFTKNSSFDANILIAMINECFYALASEFLPINSNIKKNQQFLNLEVGNNIYFPNLRCYNIINQKNYSASKIEEKINELPSNLQENLIIFNNYKLKNRDILDVIYKLDAEYDVPFNLYAAAKSLIDNVRVNAINLKEFNNKFNELNIAKKENSSASISAYRYISEEKKYMLNNFSKNKIENYKKKIDKIKKSSENNNFDYSHLDSKIYTMVENYISKLDSKKNHYLFALGLNDLSISEAIKIKRSDNDGLKAKIILRILNGLSSNVSYDDIVVANDLNIAVEPVESEMLKKISNFYGVNNLDLIDEKTKIKNLLTGKIQEANTSEKESNALISESFIISKLMQLIFGINLEVENLKSNNLQYNTQNINQIIKPVENLLGISNLTTAFFENNDGIYQLKNKKNIYESVFNRNAGKNSLDEMSVYVIVDAIYTLFDSLIFNTDQIKKEIFIDNDSISNDDVIGKTFTFRMDSQRLLLNQDITDCLRSYAFTCEII